MICTAKHIYPVWKYIDWFQPFFLLLWKLHLDTYNCQIQCPSQQAARHTVRQKNAHHWPATVSMETTDLFYSWESVNSERTWDYSYKVFPNLVIFHFHAGMDIGLQECWEWREHVFKVWHFTGVPGAVWTIICCWCAVKWTTVYHYTRLLKRKHTLTISFNVITLTFLMSRLVRPAVNSFKYTQRSVLSGDTP